MKTETPLDRQFDERIARLERMVESLMGANNVRSTTITAPGALRVLRQGGVSGTITDETVYVGVLPASIGVGKSGVLVRREDGTIALVAGAYSATHQYIAIMDRSGNIIVSDDAVSGAGLARPYIPIPFGDGDSTHWGGTSSATFVSLYSGIAYRQHPKFVGVVQVLADAGTSGELQLWDGAHGTQLALVSIGVAESAYKDVGPVDITSASALYGQVFLQWRVRRTGGAGAIHINPVYCVGVQS